MILESIGARLEKIVHGPETRSRKLVPEPMSAWISPELSM